MKKTLVTITAILAVFSASAQSKRNVLLYGGVNIYGNKDAYGRKSTSAHINPGLGYFITDNWAAGVEGTFNVHSQKDTGSFAVNNPSTKMTVGPFIRYTESLGKRFFIYGHLGTGYIIAKQGSNSPTIPTTISKGFTVALTPAVGIDLHKGFAITMNIGGLSYESMKNPLEPAPNSNFFFNFGKTVNIGISKFFGGSKKESAE